MRKQCNNRTEVKGLSAEKKPQNRSPQSSALITFTPAEIELLRIEAERVRALWKAAGVFPRRVYEEERYEFAVEWAHGNGWSTEKSIRWAERIKKEVKSLNSKKHAATAKPGASHIGAGLRDK